MRQNNRLNLVKAFHTAGHWTSWNPKVLQYPLSVLHSVSVSLLKWQGLRVLDSSWPQWEPGHLHANLNHCSLFNCSLTICRWNIYNSCRSRGVAERLLCYMCTFACIRESGFRFSYRMIHGRTLPEISTELYIIHQCGWRFSNKTFSFNNSGYEHF